MKNESVTIQLGDRHVANYSAKFMLVQFTREASNAKQFRNAAAAEKFLRAHTGVGEGISPDDTPVIVSNGRRS